MSVHFQLPLREACRKVLCAADELASEAATIGLVAAQVSEQSGNCTAPQLESFVFARARICTAVQSQSGSQQCQLLRTQCDLQAWQPRGRLWWWLGLHFRIADSVLNEKRKGKRKTRKLALFGLGMGGLICAQGMLNGNAHCNII